MQQYSIAWLEHIFNLRISWWKLPLRLTENHHNFWTVQDTDHANEKALFLRFAAEHPLRELFFFFLGGK